MWLYILGSANTYLNAEEKDFVLEMQIIRKNI